MTMAPLPAVLGGGAVPQQLVAWRVDAARHAAEWDSGFGAHAAGGRWNPRGTKAVYCSIDPSTAIIEVAVHKGFHVLDTQPHVLTCTVVSPTAGVRVVQPDEIPNPAWLHGGVPSIGQRQFGRGLLERHGVVVFPSAVSKCSWNVVFHPDVARGCYALLAQQRLVIDTRLNPG